MTLTYGAKTHKGNREANGDAIFAQVTEDNVGIFAVIHAIGSDSEAHIAAVIVRETIEQQVVSATQSLVDTSDMLTQIIQQANSDIRQHQIQTPNFHAGACVTLAIIKQEVLTIAHVGDTQAHTVSPQDYVRLTRNHDVVSRMIELGIMTLEEARTHPHRNVLYRALGQNDTIEVDIHIYDWADIRGLLLCSSILMHPQFENEVVETITMSDSPQSACDKLIEKVVNYRWVNSISAILISNGFQFTAEDVK